VECLSSPFICVEALLHLSQTSAVDSSLVEISTLKQFSTSPLVLTLRKLPFCEFFSTNYATLLRHRTQLFQGTSQNLSQTELLCFIQSRPQNLSAHALRNERLEPFVSRPLVKGTTTLGTRLCFILLSYTSSKTVRRACALQRIHS